MVKWVLTLNSELFGVEDVETPAAAAAFFLLCNKFENAYFTEKIRISSLAFVVPKVEYLMLGHVPTSSP